ncbi:probable LRR receptor-like serine/threonine-protein kinase [Tanacetum coccineum]
MNKKRSLHAKYAVLFCMFSFWIIPSVSSADDGDETDHLALLSLKAHIIFDPYQIMPTWNDSTHFCNWTGVICGLRHKRVVTLNLWSGGFSGSVSPAVGNLSFLRELLLHNNSFTGSVPHEVGKLSRLRRLGLSNNSLSGEITSNISQCLNLLELDLSGNDFIGVIPNEFEALNKLVFINLHSNNLTGEIPKFIGNFTSLQFISGLGNNFQGNIPDTLGHLSNLWFFGFASNNLSGILPPSFFNISSLTNIDLPNNQIGGTLPADIAIRFPGLKFLNLPINKLTGPIPVSLSNASNLEVLALNENAFTGSVPRFDLLERLTWFAVNVNQLGNGKSDDLDFVSSLANCSKLSILGFGANNLGGVLPKSLFNFTQLTELTVGGNMISGNIPSEIGQLVNIERLFMFSNQFSGTIPDSIGNLRNVGAISLRGNLLSGPIPSSLGNLTLLSRLFLRNNRLEGTIPASLSNCRGLQLLDISKNNLSVIPSSFGSCTSLVVLSIAVNNIQGSIPASFSSLRGLEVLDLSRNNLTGIIPEYLGDFKFFKSLNLSLNGFEGKLPEQGAFTNLSKVSVYGNTKLCGGIPEFQLPKCSHQKSRKNRIPISLIIVLPILIVVSAIIILLVIFFLVCKPRYGKKVSAGTNSDNENFQQVSYRILHDATNGFSSENLIGSGKFSSVYKAVMYHKNGPEVVAVKVLKLGVHGADNSFIAECEALRSIRHRNIVKAITSCSTLDFQGNDFKALVYSYMINGSLEDWLHPHIIVGLESEESSRHLNFIQRLNIVIDVVSALDYIHCQCGSTMVHCDVKPSNILLDADLVAHLGDFGLSKFLQQTSDSSISDTSSLGVKGTVGYAAPEYGMGSKMSTNGDIYSFGILILELFTGKRPTDDMFSNSLNLHDFVKMAIPHQVMEITDPVLYEAKQEKITCKDTYESETYESLIEECLTSVYQIGIACSMELPRHRIGINTIIDQLQLVRENFLESVSKSIRK